MRTKRRPPQSRPGQQQHKRRQGGQQQGRRQQGGPPRHAAPAGKAGPKPQYGRPGRGGGGGRPSQKQHHGPKTCPMCGAVVGDLARHIQERHDDPQSHPTD